VPTVDIVWLDNPPVNAVNGAILDAIRRAFDRLDAGTRVVVLRGRGERAFSAGADISGFKESAGSARALQQVADVIEAAPVPTLAAIHGYCLGGGLELALACDLRIVRSDAQLGFPEVRLGLLPGGGGTQRAPRLIGPARAAWLILSGERISAEQAQAWGLVEFVAADLDAEVDRVAGILADQSAGALREIKQLLAATRAEPDFAREYETFRRRVESPDGREGVAAFLEKRPPRWTERVS
jgi:enoyl-CoA hydratase/carnithine racemase